MNKKLLATAIVSCLYSIDTFGAGLDRTGQSVSAFLQSGNYGEIGFSTISPRVKGIDNSGNTLSNIGEIDSFPNAALKLQATQKLSVGLLFDEPFGTKGIYSGDNNFTANGSSGIYGPTRAEVNSTNLTGLVGYEPLSNFKLYGGFAYQQISGEANLRGPVYGVFNGYDVSFKKDGAYGWVSGLEYQIPEIGFKTSITYRSKIKHKLNTYESIQINSLLSSTSSNIQELNNNLINIDNILTKISNIDDDNSQKNSLIKQRQFIIENKSNLQEQQALFNSLNLLVPSTKDSLSDLTTPQSLNIDFQIGIISNTVLFGNLRWVDWKNFSINPEMFSTLTKAIYPDMNGFALTDYQKDQWSTTFGIGRKVNDKLSGSISVGWDSGTGIPVGSLGPTDGYWNSGIGVRYTPTSQIELSGGIKYYWLGDAKGTVAKRFIVSDFKDNNTLGMGFKFGYHF